MRQAFLVSKPLGLRLLRTIADTLDGALILHPDDAGDARSVMPQIARLCRSRGLQFQVVSNRAEADAALRNYRPDIAFVCGWYWLLSDETRALAPKGFFGIHNSLLPKYRGGAPLVWAIINGEQEVGSSLFRLEGGIDDGAIAHQVRIPLPRTATIAEATRWIESEWEAVFPSIWAGLCAGTQPLRPQEGASTLFPQRCADDGEIDWSLHASQVHDFIRAQCAPYPGAFTDFGIIEASEETWIQLDTSVGQIKTIGGEHYVRCGDGRSLRLALRRDAGSSRSFAHSSQAHT